MPSAEHTLLTKLEFHQRMEALIANPRAISQTFGSLVRYAAHATQFESRGKITANDVAYQLSPGLEGWVISVPNLAQQIPDMRDNTFNVGIGQKSIAAFEALVESFDTVPSTLSPESTL